MKKNGGRDVMKDEINEIEKIDGNERVAESESDPARENDPDPASGDVDPEAEIENDDLEAGIENESQKGIEDPDRDPEMKKDERSQSQNRVRDQTPGPVHQLLMLLTTWSERGVECSR